MHTDHRGQNLQKRSHYDLLNKHYYKKVCLQLLPHTIYILLLTNMPGNVVLSATELSSNFPGAVQYYIKILGNAMCPNI